MAHHREARRWMLDAGPVERQGTGGAPPSPGGTRSPGPREQHVDAHIESHALYPWTFWQQGSATLWGGAGETWMPSASGMRSCLAGMSRVADEASRCSRNWPLISV